VVLGLLAAATLCCAGRLFRCSGGSFRNRLLPADSREAPSKKRSGGGEDSKPRRLAPYLPSTRSVRRGRWQVLGLLSDSPCLELKLGLGHFMDRRFGLLAGVAWFWRTRRTRFSAWRGLMR